jgi:hypothetical protein
VKEPIAPLVYFLRHVSGKQPTNDVNLPNSTGQTRDTLVLRDLRLVDGNLRKLSGLLVELDRLGTRVRQYRVRSCNGDLHNRVNVDIATKVSRQVTEVGALFDDRSHVDSLVPPSFVSCAARI